MVQRDPDDWRRVREIFEQALAQPAARRRHGAHPTQHRRGSRHPRSARVVRRRLGADLDSIVLKALRNSEPVGLICVDGAVYARA